MPIIHNALFIAYLIAPPLALILTLGMRVRGQGAAWRHRTGRLAFTLSSAIVLGTAVAIAYSVALGGRVSLAQAGLLVYFTSGLLLILGAFDSAIVLALKWCWRQLRHKDRGSEPPTLWRRLLEPMPFVLRATILIGVALPYMMAVMLTYRPKVVPRDTPMSQLDLGFDDIRFQTSDGKLIAGWWIPAAQGRLVSRGLSRENFGRDTVIVCHGFAVGKSQALPFVRLLLMGGYNVLAFDFRAHGQSDGQLTSLGDLERRDVIAAVRWVREQRPRQSRRILGLGIGTGGAALIAAATDGSTPDASAPDDSSLGQAIEAIAVYGAYNDASDVARTISRTRFLPPLSWLADRVGLVLAGAQVGSDLNRFSPARDVARLWPRPIFVIHGGHDGIIPFDHGVRLFEAASEPKRCLWLIGNDQVQAIHNKSAARAVREFFDEARPVPAI